MKLLPAFLAAAALAILISHAAISTALASTADQVECPATFTVLHNDHIGSLALPAGPYTVTLLDSRMTCAGASRRLAAFLQDFDGRLPGGWTADPATATFSRDGDPMFQVAPAAAPRPTPGGGTVFPAGRRCAGTFRVLHDDHVGALALPAGRYRITLRPSGRPSCAAASRNLARFLDAPSGRLPGRWRVNAATGAFSRPGGAGFRVKPAS
jgi:hypothetical protein